MILRKETRIRIQFIFQREHSLIPLQSQSVNIVQLNKAHFIKRNMLNYTKKIKLGGLALNLALHIPTTTR
jgi:hypothetical protein